MSDHLLFGNSESRCACCGATVDERRPECVSRQADALANALVDAVSYLRLASTWIADSDRHAKMTTAWRRAEDALRDA